ncbi:hypothetical protein LVD15_22235 [Fulvivirga maritima]|uniref:hypothetical protein n=1 Tax=Fulvivirga maritima TaxID=2904247 RepID=UPI001F159050|nr:hypothetical protein [Fulvivirga maritima]UII25994.1 hypothetical protein LVD15_22235 [Fulvivirga maritima]
MKQVSKTIITAVISFIGVILMFAINFEIIDKIVVTNACKYDTSNTPNGFIFDLFYEISSNTGYHPEPSYFNFGFTAILGLILGLLFSYKLIWK